jgi:hypothetical protein
MRKWGITGFMLQKVILGYNVNLQKPTEIFAKESQMKFRFKSSSGSFGVTEGNTYNLA